jgi:hypothetical protein
LKDSVPSFLDNIDDVTYPSDIFDTIANTTIKLDEAGRGCVLEYEDGARERIVEAVSRQLQGEAVIDTDLESSSTSDVANADIDEETQEPSLVGEDATHTVTDGEQEADDEQGDDIGPRLVYNINSLDFLSLPLLDSFELRFQVGYQPLL